MQVSVVIPVYNKARYLSRCLASIKAQTFRDFEAIVVDDGSTDGSRGIAESFAGDDSRFLVIAQANAGPGSARNAGVSRASGELIAFLDADDEWHPAYLEDNLHALDRAGTGIAAVVSGYLEFPQNVNREAMWRKRGIVEGTFRVTPETPGIVLSQLLAYHACGNTMVRRSVFEALGGFYALDRCVFGEDSWFWIQVILSETVLVRFEPLTIIHRDASELSGNYREARPVEPFLRDPAPLQAMCPVHLRPVLRDFLAIRAFKTACVLGYWGQWRAAARLRARFSGSGDFRLPFFWPALVCSTPLGGILGKLWRCVWSPVHAPQPFDPEKRTEASTS